MKDNWQEEKLFFEAAEYFQELIQDIQNAKHNITLETYIFKNDDIGSQIINALIDAASRGVSIKVLMDGIGSYEDGKYIFQKLTAANIDTRIFSPLPWSFSSYYRIYNKEKWYIKWINFFWRINKRSHRKLCTVDHYIAWVGSFNIMSYLDKSSGILWKDIAVRVEGEHVKKIEQTFSDIWNRADKQRRYYRFRYFLSNHTFKMRHDKNAQLIKFINTAHSRIWIVNAYFSPSVAFLRALKLAAKRNVSIKLIVPQKSDVIFFPDLTRTYYADLLRAGVHIYEYREKILHEKSMLIDDKAIVGSTNLNYRSFFHDLELDLLLTRPDTIYRMKCKFMDDVEHSQKITPYEFQRYPRLSLVIGWLARFLRYWL